MSALEILPISIQSVKQIIKKMAEAIKSIQRSNYSSGFNLPGTYESTRGASVSLDSRQTVCAQHQRTDECHNQLAIGHRQR